MASNSPLAPQAYVSEEQYSLEIEVVGSAPNYLGHLAMIPRPGNVIPVRPDKRILLLNADGAPAALDNLCPHRGALMHNDAFYAEKDALVCPWHGWAFGLNGEAIRPAQAVAEGCQLSNHPVEIWNNLIFLSGPECIRSRSGLHSEEPVLDFLRLGWRFDRVEETAYQANWKILVEVFLDNYHIPFIHKGFSDFVDTGAIFRGEGCSSGDNWLFQEAPLSPKWRESSSGRFRLWAEVIEASSADEISQVGARWLVLYPNLIIEWYPFTLIINRFIPQAENETLAISEFFYDTRLGSSLEQFRQAESPSSEEVQSEDDALIVALQRGRSFKADLQHKSGGAPWVTPVENGIAHFHQWLRTSLAQLESRT